MHKVGTVVKYEQEHKLRPGEKFSGKGKIIGTYRVYVILDLAEADKSAPYTTAVHENHVERPTLPSEDET